jgi:hypothetical protein
MTVGQLGVAQTTSPPRKQARLTPPASAQTKMPPAPLRRRHWQQDGDCCTLRAAAFCFAHAMLVISPSESIADVSPELLLFGRRHLVTVLRMYQQLLQPAPAAKRDPTRRGLGRAGRMGRRPRQSERTGRPSRRRRGRSQPSVPAHRGWSDRSFLPTEAGSIAPLRAGKIAVRVKEGEHRPTPQASPAGAGVIAT